MITQSRAFDPRKNSPVCDPSDAQKVIPQNSPVCDPSKNNNGLTLVGLRVAFHRFVTRLNIIYWSTLS